MAHRGSEMPQMPKGHPEAMKGMEDIDISVKPLQLGSSGEEQAGLNEYIKKIEALEFNALDTSQNQRAEGTHGDRKKTAEQMRSDMLKSGDHDLAFVAERKGEVVGFIAIKTDGEVARMQQMWTSVGEERQQKAVAAKLIDFALDELELGSTPYHRLNINLGKSSEGLRKACSDSERAKKLVTGEEKDQVKAKTLH